MWIATTGSLDGRVRVAAYAHRTNVAGPQFHGDVEVKTPLGVGDTDLKVAARFAEE